MTDFDFFIGLGVGFMLGAGAVYTGVRVSLQQIMRRSVELAREQGFEDGYEKGKEDWSQS